MTFIPKYLRIYVASQIEELRRHIRVILADSGVIDKVQATPFEIAIGSSGTIESIEQMIHHTVTTSTDSQVRVGHLVKAHFSGGQIWSLSSCETWVSFSADQSDASVSPGFGWTTNYEFTT